ncbi:MAG: LacI family DNA-binding transcriptional regulator [Ideonella sp.]
MLTAATARKMVGSGRRATSYDVASLAGVSQSTVSRAFTPDAPISTALRKKVLVAARRLNYQPNAVARSLTTNQSRVVAFFVPNIANPLYPFVLDAFSRRLRTLDRQILLLPQVESADEALSWLMQFRIEGLVITAASPLALSEAVARKCLKAGIPVVLFNRRFPDVQTPSVNCDNLMGGAVAAETLVGGGHRRFAFVGGSEPTSSHADRCSGFVSRLHELGAPAPLVETTSFTYEGGYTTGLRLLAQRDRPDAIFCVTDLVALGVLDAARHGHGLQVPRDLSIMGFDDIPMSAWAGNDLTTVRFPVEDMVERAVELLGRAIENQPVHGQVVQVSGELVIRSSTRPLPALLPDARAPQSIHDIRGA